MKISSFSVGCFALAFFSAQISLVLFFENFSLKREIRISQKLKELADDQINELTHAVSNLQSEKDSISTKQFVAGVIESLNRDKKDYLSAVWHDGYDRGTSVMSYTVEVQGKKD